MIRRFTLLILLFLFYICSFSQDVITRKNGDQVKCKITGTDSINVYFHMHRKDGVLLNTYLNKNEIQNISDYNYKNIFKLNFPALFVKTINLSYERVLNNYLSIQIQGFCLISTFKFTTNTQNFSSYYGISPEIRIYPFGKAATGFFLAPYFRYKHFSFWENISNSVDYTGSPENSINYSTGIYSGGFIAGYAWVFKNRLSLDVYCGPGYYTKTSKSAFENFENNPMNKKMLLFGPSNINEDAGTDNFNGLTLRLGATIGYAF